MLDFFFLIMEHLHSSLRRERHHPHHHHHHHFEPEQCEMEEWSQQLDLEDHIRRCQCSCNHMGYGNYWSYKVKTIWLSHQSNCAILSGKKKRDFFFRGIIRFDSYRFPLKLLLWHCTSIQFLSFLFTSWIGTYTQIIHAIQKGLKVSREEEEEKTLVLNFFKGYLV